MTPWWQMSAALQKHWTVCQSLVLNEEENQTGVDVSEIGYVQVRFGCGVDKNINVYSQLDFFTFVPLFLVSIKDLV